MAFGAPLVLLGLLTLPLIWWLLRLVPPRPTAEMFPPLRLLAQLVKQEETPAQSPWWLTALRLAMAAMVIIALARPLLDPDDVRLTGEGPLLVMIDNGWARPDQWDDRVALARRILDEADRAGRPVALAETVAPRTRTASLTTAEEAGVVLDAIAPVAALPNRKDAMARLQVALDGSDASNAELVILSDGFAHSAIVGPDAAPQRVSIATLYRDDLDPVAVIRQASNGAQDLTASIDAIGTGTDGLTVTAYDSRGRAIAQSGVSTGEDGRSLQAVFDEPFQLRNDFAWLAIDGMAHAGAVHMLDDSDRRRRVGLLSGVSADTEQPLLAPLYYIRRAVEPFTDIIEGRTGDLSIDIPEMLEQGPAVLFMADIGVVPPQTRDALNAWIEAGGTLVRFSGPRLAAQADDDPFLPVPLRVGERSLTGALSWTEPQPVAPFPSASPFSDLAAPQDVTVDRQVLAEPGPALNERSWAILADGTPLVTGDRRGQGTIVLFHVTAEATWSNLPITGSFVEMLRRIVTAASNTNMADNIANAETTDATSFAPARILDASGRLQIPAATVEPITAEILQATITTYEHPGGLYGDDSAFAALNVVTGDDPLAVLDATSIAPQTRTLAYPARIQTSLAPWLLAAALALLFFDTLAVLWINGRLSRSAFRRPATAALAMIVATAATLAVSVSEQAFAQTSDRSEPMDEATAIDLINVTRIAYVVTGVTATDEMSRAGLDGLSRFIASRTALEPGAPVGVDLSRDELAFFPLIYYPIDPSAEMPSAAALARLDAYMQAGGTVLFDTRDDLMSSFDGQTEENRYLRALLADLNIPPLEPVPDDHVLTKAFYILNSFPGRYAGSPLWVEALPERGEAENRPVRTADGVSPVMITGNDFAAAWALDETGSPIAAMSGGDPLQRIYAFRVGVNIMMYMLTGNYKADQVHIPALLERLGQ